MKTFSVYFGAQRLMTVTAKSGRAAREYVSNELRDARKPRDPSFAASTLTAKERRDESN